MKKLLVATIACGLVLNSAQALAIVFENDNHLAPTETELFYEHVKYLELEIKKTTAEIKLIENEASNRGKNWSLNNHEIRLLGLSAAATGSVYAIANSLISAIGPMKKGLMLVAAGVAIYSYSETENEYSRALSKMSDKQLLQELIEKKQSLALQAENIKQFQN